MTHALDAAADEMMAVMEAPDTARGDALRVVRAYLDALDAEAVGAEMEWVTEISWHELREVVKAIRP